MKYFIYSIVLSLLLICFFQPKISLADAFVVNLVYDQSAGTLSLGSNGITYDKNLTLPLSDLYNPPANGAYKIILFEDKGVQDFAWQFNPQNGSFSVNLPYFSVAKSLEVIEPATNRIILQADLSKLSSCNNNGLCEFEKGENIYTCLPDCASGIIKYDLETAKLLKENKGVLKDPETGKILLRQAAAASQNNNNFLIYGLIILIVVIGAIIWIIIRRRPK